MRNTGKKQLDFKRKYLLMSDNASSHTVNLPITHVDKNGFENTRFMEYSSASTGGLGVGH